MRKTRSGDVVPPYNIYRFKNKAVGVHDDDDVRFGLGILQPMDNAHRFVVRQIRVLALRGNGSWREHHSTAAGQSRRTMSQGGATCVFTEAMR